MATKLKHPGASKLARPAGSGLKGPAAGLKRPAMAQSAMKPPSLSPSAGRRQPGVVRPPAQASPAAGTGRGTPKAAPPPQQVATSEPAELDIGDRVLVAGVKAGTIAFLGPTQFARGVWAGVVLDTRDGKNNGCVNGVQYFECEANKGLFARPEKLELLSKASPPSAPPSKPPPSGSPQEGKFAVGDRVAIEGGKHGQVAFYGTTAFSRGVWVGVVLETAEGKNAGRVGDVQYFECAPNHGLFIRPQKLRLIERGTSPRQQRGSSQEAESRNHPAPNQSPVLDLKLLREKLKLGDRVLVGGAKEGFLRYLGPTEFAKGVWAGVELEEPLGKNDGAVSGKRYFQCPPRHGLFAPLPKVEKLADSGPPPDEANSSPGSTRRAGGQLKQSPQLSNSSSSSLGKPPVTGATPTSSVRGAGEAGLSHVVQEKEAIIAALQATLQGKEREEKEMAERITNLSRTVEDLQFQLEEQDVISGDKLEVVEEGTQQQLAQLEEQLAREREECSRLRHQLHTQSSEAGSGEAGSGEAVDSQREGLSRLLVEREGEVDQLKEELASAKLSSSNLSSQLQIAHNKIDQLMASFRKAEEGGHEKSSVLESELAQAEETVSELRSEAATVKQDLQNALELCSEHEVLMEERNKELETCDAEIRALKKERESWKNEQARLISEQQKLASERDQAIMECDRLMTNSSNIGSEQSELSRQRQSLMSERDQLVAECQAQRTEIEKVVSERDEFQQTLQQLQLQRQDEMGQSREIGAKYESIHEELSAAQTDVERLRLELMSATSKADQERLALQEQIELAKAGETELHSRVEQMAGERDSTLTRAQEMSDKLVEVEKERDSLQEIVVRSSGEITRLQDELEEVTRSHNILEREVASESGALQQRLEVAEETLGEKERELTEARERISNLSDELVISHGKRDQVMLEEEKELLEERVMELTVQLEQAQSSKVPGAELREMDAPSQEQLQSMQETIQDYEQQVDFLNSVIADLQQKLEAAESLQLMGAGDMAVMSDDEEGVAQLPPPRLFCDICDQFDLHDTDDCPLQAASDSPPPSSYGEPRAPGGSDRPYCNNCEVFGHHTEECEYDVTY